MNPEHRALRLMLFAAVGALLFILGYALGSYSLSDSVPLLPTRIPLTPVNYRAALQATTVPLPTLPEPTPMPTLTGDLLRGKELYVYHCAHCHGLLGAGEPGFPNQDVPDAVGYMPVPRHDSYGHTWLHPDQLLIKSIMQGIQNPLSRYGMDAFEGLITEQEAMMILEYIKLWWTPEQRAQQAAATERFRLAQDDPNLFELTSPSTQGQ